jgi:hypothetical protein
LATEAYALVWNEDGRGRSHPVATTVSEVFLDPFLQLRIIEIALEALRIQTDRCE